MFLEARERSKLQKYLTEKEVSLPSPSVVILDNWLGKRKAKTTVFLLHF